MVFYQYHVKNLKWRLAIANVHTCTFEIGWDRHTNPNLPVAYEKCLHCDVTEDEKLFLLKEDHRL